MSARPPLPLSAKSAKTAASKPESFHSARGKRYRAQRKQYEDELEGNVQKMSSDVTALICQRVLLLERSLTTRHTSNSALVKLAHEYYTKVRHGVPRPNAPADESPRSRQLGQWTAQEEFLRRVMTPEVIVGRSVGIDAVIAHWQLYTSAFNGMRKDITTISIEGAKEDPMVIVKTVTSLRIIRDTFAFVFPSARPGEDVIQRFIGMEVRVKTTARINFTPDGKISLLLFEPSYVQSLLDAGTTLRDLASLLRQAPDAKSMDAANTEPTSLTLARGPNAVEPRKRRRPNRKLPDSVRSRIYRAKQQRLEDNLKADVTMLKDHLAALSRARDLMHQQSHLDLNSSPGSLVTQLCDFCAQYQYGSAAGADTELKIPSLYIHGIRLTDPHNPRYIKCETFLRRAFDANTLASDIVGLNEVLSGSPYYTAGFSSLRIEIVAIEVAGTEEDPTVRLRMRHHVRLSRQSFRVLFPALPHDDPLVAKYLNTQMALTVTILFQLTAEGQLAQSTQEMDTVEAFMTAGASMQDIVRLLESTTSSSEASKNDPEGESVSETNGEVAQETAAHGEKLALGFLLAPDKEELSDY